MGKYITVKIMRGGAVIYPSVFLQLDNMESAEAADYGGASPFFRYNAYILNNLTVRQGDLLVDLNATDPKTGTLVQYRVIDDPENFPDNHTEISAERVRGV